MLDNKQRAHDLALIITEYELRNSESKIDVYKTYMNVYKMALESFNHDFPEEK